MKRHAKLVGRQVYLTPIGASEEEVEAFTTWLNDLELAVQLAAFHFHLNLEQERAALSMLAEQGNVFAIRSTDDDRLLGSCGIESVDMVNRTGECGIFIGDADRRGRGNGSEALNLLLDWGFNGLNLNNIWLKVYAFNARAIALYERMGFQEIGRRREARILGDRKYDLVYMDMLAEEFESPYIEGLLSRETE